MHCSPCDFLVTSLDVLPTSALMIVWLAVTEFIKSWEWDSLSSCKDNHQFDVNTNYGNDSSLV